MITILVLFLSFVFLAHGPCSPKTPFRCKLRLSSSRSPTLAAFCLGFTVWHAFGTRSGRRLIYSRLIFRYVLAYICRYICVYVLGYRIYACWRAFDLSCIKNVTHKYDRIRAFSLHSALASDILLLLVFTYLRFKLSCGSSYIRTPRHFQLMRFPGSIARIISINENNPPLHVTKKDRTWYSLRILLR